MSAAALSIISLCRRTESAMARSRAIISALRARTSPAAAASRFLRAASSSSILLRASSANACCRASSSSSVLLRASSSANAFCRAASFSCRSRRYATASSSLLRASSRSRASSSARLRSAASSSSSAGLLAALAAAHGLHGGGGNSEGGGVGGVLSGVTVALICVIGGSSGVGETLNLTSQADGTKSDMTGVPAHTLAREPKQSSTLPALGGMLHVMRCMLHARVLERRRTLHLRARALRVEERQEARRRRAAPGTGARAARLRCVPLLVLAMRGDDDGQVEGNHRETQHRSADRERVARARAGRLARAHVPERGGRRDEA